MPADFAAWVEQSAADKLFQLPAGGISSSVEKRGIEAFILAEDASLLVPLMARNARSAQ